MILDFEDQSNVLCGEATFVQIFIARVPVRELSFGEPGRIANGGLSCVFLK